HQRHDGHRRGPAEGGVHRGPAPDHGMRRGREEGKGQGSPDAGWWWRHGWDVLGRTRKTRRTRRTVQTYRCDTTPRGCPPGRSFCGVPHIALSLRGLPYMLLRHLITAIRDIVSPLQREAFVHGPSTPRRYRTASFTFIE